MRGESPQVIPWNLLYGWCQSEWEPMVRKQWEKRRGPGDERQQSDNAARGEVDSIGPCISIPGDTMNTTL